MNYEMVKRLFRPGDLVTVKSDISKTDRFFSATSKMLRLRGEQITIESVGWSGVEDRPPYVSAAGFSWHPSDLLREREGSEKLVTTMGQTGVFKFDVKSL